MQKPLNRPIVSSNPFVSAALSLAVHNLLEGIPPDPLPVRRLYARHARVPERLLAQLCSGPRTGGMLLDERITTYTSTAPEHAHAAHRVTVCPSANAYIEVEV
eukprot:716297-Pyramimonas_sp.AAC.2